MSQSPYLGSVLDADCNCNNQMRAAYFMMEEERTGYLAPYFKFVREESSIISRISNFYPGDKGKDGTRAASYCWTTVSDFQIPESTISSMDNVCGGLPNNVDYNTVDCSNMRFKGWLKELHIGLGVTLCEPIGLTDFVNRTRAKKAEQEITNTRPGFLYGVFQGVEVDCKQKTAIEFADFTIDSSATGITESTFLQLQAYMRRIEEPISRLMVFLTQTGFDQLRANYRTIDPNCCLLRDVTMLSKMGYLIDPATGIEFTVIDDATMEKYTGSKQLMFALNDRYTSFVPGSSVLTARSFTVNGAGQCSNPGVHFIDLRGSNNLYNVVEGMGCNPIGKQPGIYLSYYSLNSFIKFNSRSLIIIKGKVAP